MSLQACGRILVALFLALVVGWASVARAEIIYEETWEVTPGSGDQPFSSFGWSLSHDPPYGTGYSGAYSYQTYDAATNQPINGASGVYIGAGGPLTNAEEAFYVVDGSGDFVSIDPTQCDRLYFAIYAKVTGTQPGDDHGYFAIHAYDPNIPRDPGQWYVQTTPMETPTASGDFMDDRQLLYDPTSGWEEIDFSTMTRGAAAPDLTGLWIGGVGIVHRLNNPVDDYSSWDYADYRILCVPEPATAMLASCVAAFVLCQRRRRMS